MRILALSSVILIFLCATECYANPSTVYTRHAIQDEAKGFAERGELDQAIALYEKAMRPEFISTEFDKGLSIGALQEIYKWKNDFGKAKEMARWYIKVNPTLDDNIDQLTEIEAIESYVESGDPKAVHAYIFYLRKKKSSELPPLAYSGSGSTVIYISDIIRLYDTIEDYEAGIKYIDEILDWICDTDPEFKGLKSIRFTAQIGDKYLWKPKKLINKDWRAYKFLREYILVREAFEQSIQDRKNGIPKEKGKPGRATQALIKSDYFPW